MMLILGLIVTRTDKGAGDNRSCQPRQKRSQENYRSWCFGRHSRNSTLPRVRCANPFDGFRPTAQTIEHQPLATFSRARRSTCFGLRFKNCAATSALTLLAIDDHANVHSTSGKGARDREYQLAYFRHTYSTFVRANGEDPKDVQELLRHWLTRVTMESILRLSLLRNAWVEHPGS
jgi:hypothetical protein